MKDRIRHIMESQHMTQQVFAQFINIAPATLSGIFNGRTNPSLNIVQAIKNSLPSISTDWLLFGTGPMYIDQKTDEGAAPSSNAPSSSEQILDFDFNSSTPATTSGTSSARPAMLPNVRRPDPYIINKVEKPQRQITEIRIFFDDQTWESFVPKK